METVQQNGRFTLFFLVNSTLIYILFSLDLSVWQKYLNQMFYYNHIIICVFLLLLLLVNL